MALETATYISQLTATNPVASDSVSVGDDHIRMLKTVLKTQFSGLSGTTAVTATEAEMNYLDLATLGTSAAMVTAPDACVSALESAEVPNVVISR